MRIDRTPRLATAGLLFLTAICHADDPADGFQRTELPVPAGTLAVSTLSYGGFVAFDGIEVGLYDSTGVLQASLTTLGAFAYPSFLIVNDAENELILGESTTGTIYSMALVPSAATPVTSISFNYDAVYVDANTLLVSAATRAFGTNQILRVDLMTGATVEVADVAGPSGPIATDGVFLYYATSVTTFPAPPGSTDVLAWPLSMLDGSVVRSEADASIVQSGLDGGSSFALDAWSGELFLAVNNFGSGLNEIRRIVPHVPSPDDVVMSGLTGRTIGDLDFVPGNQVAVFDAFQPVDGGALTYTSTDFASVYERASVEPLRPTASVTGPGTTGPGAFEVAVTDAPASGFGILYYGPQSSLPASEYVLQLSLPLFLGLDLATVARVPGITATDAAGFGSSSYVNPGGLEGLFAVQFVLFDAAAQLAGSSERALF